MQQKVCTFPQNKKWKTQNSSRYILYCFIGQRVAFSTMTSFYLLKFSKSSSAPRPATKCSSPQPNSGSAPDVCVCVCVCACVCMCLCMCVQSWKYMYVKCPLWHGWCDLSVCWPLTLRQEAFISFWNCLMYDVYSSGSRALRVLIITDQEISLQILHYKCIMFFAFDMWNVWRLDFTALQGMPPPPFTKPIADRLEVCTLISNDKSGSSAGNRFLGPSREKVTPGTFSQFFISIFTADGTWDLEALGQQPRTMALHMGLYTMNNTMAMITKATPTQTPIIMEVRPNGTE